MGLLIEGNWHDRWYDTGSSGGRFVRGESRFRSWVTADGAAGPSGEAGFAAEAGRYHLYVSLACPWAHRTLIFRLLKGLEPLVGVTVVSPDMLDEGWAFTEPEPLHGFTRLHQVYTLADPGYTGRVTVPVLFDRTRGTIVSNESSEIIRMLNSAFDGLTGNTDDYYPEELREAIDAVNAEVYANVNNGVYRCGFATTQEAYEEAFAALFETLDALEARLAAQPFLAGDLLTEADWRLFTTLVRFDAVYHGHFKCNRQRIADYPTVQDYLRALYQHPGVAQTVDIEHIKRHYYYSHESINPTRIVPVGPVLSLDAPHGRGPARVARRDGTATASEVPGMSTPESGPEGRPGPRIAGRAPVAVELQAGKEYYWCACGRSASQPFCDGSHRGTGISPLDFSPEIDSRRFLCLCKRTRNPPYCDGSHNAIEDAAER